MPDFSNLNEALATSLRLLRTDATDTETATGVRELLEITAGQGQYSAVYRPWYAAAVWLESKDRLTGGDGASFSLADIQDFYAFQAKLDGGITVPEAWKVTLTSTNRTSGSVPIEVTW